MSILRNVVFKSTAFNTTTPREYFINECCFGDDLARWMIQAFHERGIHAEPEPGQEDFGWYLSFRIGETEYDLVLGYRPEEDDRPGDWVGTIERRAGLLRSLFGARKRGIHPDTPRAIHAVLSSSPLITDIRWYTDEDFDREENAQSSP